MRAAQKFASQPRPHTAPVDHGNPISKRRGLAPRSLSISSFPFLVNSERANSAARARAPTTALSQRPLRCYLPGRALPRQDSHLPDQRTFIHGASGPADGIMDAGEFGLCVRPGSIRTGNPRWTSLVRLHGEGHLVQQRGRRGGGVAARSASGTSIGGGFRLGDGEHVTSRRQAVGRQSDSRLGAETL